MRRKPLAFISIIALIFTLFPSNAMAKNNSFLSSVPNEKTFAEGFDTLAYSNDAYQKLGINMDADSKDQIRNVIIGFLATQKAYVRSPQNYTRSFYFTSESLTSKSILYRLSESDYLKELNNVMGWTILGDNLSFSLFRTSIFKEHSRASIVEDYRYYVSDDFGGESFRRREYTFDLFKKNGYWKITDIKTNDPWESDESFSYEEININKIAPEYTIDSSNINCLTSSDLTSSDIDKAAISSSLYPWTYSTSDAVAYAINHYADDESTSDLVFGFTVDNNCQNFASQCVWAGLGGSGTSTSVRPAVSISIAGSSSPNVWQRNVNSTYYSSSLYWLNWTWDNARGFANMIKVSLPTLEGPYGNTQYSGYFGYTSVGNVLEVDWGNAPARDTLDHAMFVTQVSGSSGSRTTSQVKIAAHTSPTNSAYQTLSSYTSMASSAFARVVIQSGYYAVPQS